MELYKENGTWKVSFIGANGKRQHRSTKTSLREEAEEVVKLARIAEIEMAAKAKSLNAESLTAIMAGRKVTTGIALDEWEQVCTKDLSANTTSNRAIVARQWTRFSGLELASPIGRLVTYENIDAFVNEKETSRSTRDMRLAVCRSLSTFCSARAYIVGDPGKTTKVRIKSMTHQQRESKPRSPVTSEEYDKLMAAAPEGFWKYAISLSFWAGFRMVDVCCMEWASLSGEAITLWSQKTENRVRVPINEPLVGGGVLQGVIMEMMMESDGGVYCFPDERDTILNPKKRAKLAVYAGRIFAKAGVEGKTFHCLRHGFATRLNEAGKPLEEIGQLLGHTNTETTKIYVHDDQNIRRSDTP